MAATGLTTCGALPLCRALTSASRCLSTARWLMEPLSVTSPLSMLGGSVNQRAVLKHRDALVTALHDGSAPHVAKPVAATA